MHIDSNKNGTSLSCSIYESNGSIEKKKFKLLVVRISKKTSVRTLKGMRKIVPYLDRVQISQNYWKFGSWKSWKQW